MTKLNRKQQQFSYNHQKEADTAGLTNWSKMSVFCYARHWTSRICSAVAAQDLLCTPNSKVAAEGEVT
jgi:hypothetical protein